MMRPNRIGRVVNDFFNFCKDKQKSRQSMMRPNRIGRVVNDCFNFCKTNAGIKRIYDASEADWTCRLFFNRETRNKISCILIDFRMMRPNCNGRIVFNNI
jgi:hypothetical protein